MSIKEQVLALVTRPLRAIRRGREDELKPKNLGNMTVYTFKDVLDYAYDKGFSHFNVDPVEYHTTLSRDGKPMTTASVRATAYFWDHDPLTGGIRLIGMQATGDANHENCANRVIGMHYPRMAETRAKARALAHALNLDANLAEEMGEDDPQPARKSYTPRKESVPTDNNPYPKEDPSQFPEQNVEGGWACEETGERLKDTAASSAGHKAMWSKRKYGRILSYNTQKTLGLVK